MLNGLATATDPSWRDGRPAQSGVAMMLELVNRLPVSGDPELVFGALAELCVPALADSCVLSLVRPNSSQLRLVGTAMIQIPISLAGIECDQCSGCGRPAAPQSGTLSLLFHRSRPSSAHSLAAQLLVDRASAIVNQQRAQLRLAALGNRLHNLELALDTSREIGIAIGIVMQRYQLDAGGAFDLLSRISQRTRRKLRVVAAEVVDTGVIDLPAGLLAVPDQPQPARQYP
ncbi:MAG: ANTAR domain-containing protein [Jatrophihabitantaceae bacterium]